MRRFTGSFSFVAGMALFISVVMLSGCDEDEVALSGVPSAPTSFYPENGAVVTGSEIKIVVEGGKAENQSPVGYYVYFGTERDNLERFLIHLKHELSPGTQYFWQVIPYTNDQKTSETIYGEPSEIMTFYSAPSPLSGLESDNGEEEVLVILRWDEPENCRQVKITFTPESSAVKQPIIIPAGQDSCEIKGLLDFHPDDHAFITYTFNVEAEVNVGDRILTTEPLTIDEIPLNKAENVRDFDYNVYRCVRIGNQVWLRENLRTTRMNDGTALVEGKDYAVGSQSDVYGLYYKCFTIVDDYKLYYSWSKKELAPKGFKIATWQDWTQLFKELGAADEDFQINSLTAEEYLFDEIAVGSKLKSRTGWPVSMELIVTG